MKIVLNKHTNTNIKKLNTILIIVLVLSIPLSADDGSWSKSFSIAGGSIYAEEDNPDIALEKELLIFNGRETRAVFLFKNTSDRPVTVECGFPVTHLIASYMIDGGLELPEGKYGSSEIPGLSFFETLPHPWLSDDEDIFASPEIIPLTDFNNSREFIEASEAQKAGIDFKIFQDGREIDVEGVLLERKVSQEGASLVFHFKHALHFQPKETSTVEVIYSQDLVFGSDGPGITTYSWKYVIGTGGTWKGSIGEFWFLKPARWNGDIPGMALTQIKDPASSEEAKYGIDLLYAQNYEPDRRTVFKLSNYSLDMMEQYEYFDSYEAKKAMWTDRSPLLPPPLEPAQAFIRDIEASSNLTDTFDIFVDKGVIKQSGFGPEAAFDGIPETAWSEAARGDGEGEYLSLRLTEPVDGIIICNGFTRFPSPDWIFDSGHYEERFLDTTAGLKNYYAMNNRVKTLEILDQQSTSRGILSLEDKREPQVFYLPRFEPGTYRFVIRDVYPGDKWDDTCLGELTFLKAQGPRQDFISSSFFTEHIKAGRY